MRTINKKYNYGRCHVCSSKMEEKIIDQDFWINGKLVVIKNIPAGVCLQCGEKVVKANIGHFVANLIENPKIISKAPRISVPVLKFNF